MTEHRTQVYEHVASQFPKTLPCKIAFVGEAPGDEETLENQTLVGPSGRCFNQLLRRADLERSEYYVGNVFDEQLPTSPAGKANDLKQWCHSNKAWTTQFAGIAPPADPEFDPYIDGAGYLDPAHWWQLGRLQAELRKVSPTLIVPMGGTALWAFTGSSAITDARGAVGVAKYIMPGTKILPIFHPAYILRVWKLHAQTIDDLGKARREAGFGDIRTTKRRLWIAPTLADMDHFYREFIKPARLLSVDIETGGGQITCFGVSADATNSITVPFVDYRKPSRSYWSSVADEVQAWSWVERVCGSTVPKLFQNGPYDIYWLWYLYGIKVMNYSEDTRLLHHALYPELPKSLGYMGASYANERAWKLMRERKNSKRDD